MNRNRFFLGGVILILSSTILHAQHLISVEKLSTIPSSFFSIFIGDEAKYDVDNYKILYISSNLQGEPDTVSGLITIPLTNEIASPLLIVQHGTVTFRNDVPSRLGGGYELGAAFSSIGYISIQPDYLGLGDSKGLHPYLHAPSESQVAIDLLFAVKTYLNAQDIFYNEQVFLTGYSQGGHAAMAAHRLLESNFADEIEVTAAAHLSGPYSISGVLKDRLISDIPYYYPGYAAWTILSYNEAYGLYDSLEQYFKPSYANLTRQFYNEEITLDDLHDQMIDQLTTDFGSPIVKFMFQDSLIVNIVNNERHPLNIALKTNDTYDWAPIAPTRLFYCTGDDQVPFLNSLIADSVMQANGALDVHAMDVDFDADHRGCILPAGLAAMEFFNQFADLNATSSDLIAVDNDISIFPNPARDWINIKNLPHASVLAVYDMSGRQVMFRSLEKGSSVIATNHFNSGLYILQILDITGTRSIPISIFN